MARLYLSEFLEGHHVHGCSDTFLATALSALRKLLKLLVKQCGEILENISKNFYTCLASSESDKDLDSIVGEVQFSFTLLQAHLNNQYSLDQT